MEKFDAVISRAVESGLIGFWMNEFVKGKFGGDALAWKVCNISFQASGG
jgi:hypothetical protein